MINNKIKYAGTSLLLALSVVSISYALSTGVITNLGNNQTATAANSILSCPSDYVCLRKSDADGLYKAYLAATSVSGYNTKFATSTSFSVANPSKNVVWKKGSKQAIGWYSTSDMKGKIEAYLIPEGSINSVGKMVKYPKYLVMSTNDINKGYSPINNGNLDKVPYGKYYILLESNKLSAVSKYTVEVIKHDDPLITITSPISSATLDNNTPQRITWTANFVKEGNTKDDPVYKDIRFVPTYGIDYVQNDVSAYNLSLTDKKILFNLSDEDKAILGVMSANQLDDLTSANIGNVVGLSSAGKTALVGLSLDGYAALKTIDFLNASEMTKDFTLTKIKGVSTSNSDSKTTTAGGITAGVAVGGPTGALVGVAASSGVLNSILGDEKPDTVKATVYLVDTAGVETKLKNTYIEAAKTKISLKDVKAGQYKLKIVAKLKNTTVQATSNSFTVRAVK